MGADHADLADPPSLLRRFPLREHEASVFFIPFVKKSGAKATCFKQMIVREIK